VLIPEVQPRRLWDYLLFNQRGVMLDRAIRRGTANVVLCRLRYRLEQLAPHDAGPARDAGPAAADAAPDAPADAVPDAPADAMPDAPADAVPDAPADAVPDAPADAVPDAPAAPAAAPPHG